MDASIGIAMAPADGTEADQLLKNADLAMYGAKAGGRATYRFFEAEMDAEMKARRALEFDLRQAIMCGELELFYQPLVNIRDKTIVACEALLRWRHPVRGLVSPGEFIPVAEDAGIVNQLGEFALRTACAEATNWRDDILVTVNVSPVQFKNEGLVPLVMSALAESGLPAQRLELEITESVLLHDDEATLRMLGQLRELGVRIAMDDFGVGYSSLNYLRRFPFDKVKIDKSFIEHIAEDASSLAIAQAVISIAKSRDIATTAEGVEKQEQYELLRALGCTEMQGYLFSPPKPVAELAPMLLPRPAEHRQSKPQRRSVA
jgi:predicted signal transduction protein with EAL and GGDEF domain